MSEERSSTLNALSGADDIVAWMSLLPQGRSALRDFFLIVRSKKIDGAQLLASEPEETINLLGMQGPLALHFAEHIAKVRTQYIKACIASEIQASKVGKGMKGSVSKKKKQSSKDLGLALNKRVQGDRSLSLGKRGSISVENNLAFATDSPRQHDPDTARHNHDTKPILRSNMWIILKEGYLYKKKKVKKGFHKSTKLRFFSLKQDPITRYCQLEYSEGLVVKGILPLQNTEIKLLKPGVFIIKTNDREVELATERNERSGGIAWVLALQQATLTAKQDVVRTVMVYPPDQSNDDGQDQKPEEQEKGAQPPRRRRGGDEELDEEKYGEMIDNARWAALRKGWEKWKQGQETSDVNTDEDDEEVRLMREMEEAEERRQEDERQQWLAQRAEKQAMQPEDQDSEDQQHQLPSAGDEADDAFSEDEEDWLAEMLAQEQAEEKKQEQERLEWLAQKEAREIS